MIKVAKSPEPFLKIKVIILLFPKCQMHTIKLGLKHPVFKYLPT